MAVEIHQHLLVDPKKDLGKLLQHRVVGLSLPGSRPAGIDRHQNGPMGGISRQDEAGHLRLPLRPEIGIDQPRAEELAAGTRAVGMNAAARSAHAMNAPAPGRLAQFLDQINLAAQVAGAATAAGNKRGLDELGGRIWRGPTTQVRATPVFARHVTFLQRGPAAPRARGAIRDRGITTGRTDRNGSNSRSLRRFRGVLPRRSLFRCWMEPRERRHGCPETGPCLRASSSALLHSRRERSAGRD